jgi:ethanolamine utilization protein EutN
MQLGHVIGTATSTVKHASMNGQKLLVVQLTGVDGRSPDGEPVLAIDSLGAGHGDRVILSSDGRYVREILKSETTPVRWCVLGVRDE